MLYSTRNNLRKPGSSDPPLISDINSNTDIIDAAISKKNWTATSDPTAGDDSNDGYSVGSRWHNTSSGDKFECEDATAGSAVWIKYYPQESESGVTDHGALSGLGDDDHAIYIKDSEYTAKGKILVGTAAGEFSAVTVGSDDQVLTADSAQASGVKWTTPATVVTDHGNLTGLSDDDHPQYIKDSEYSTKGQILVATGSGTYTALGVGSNSQILTSDSSEASGVKWAAAAGGGAAFWTDVPGTPTRVSDTQFTITDSSNANKYDKIFTKGTIIKWLESTTINVGMIISASYGSNTVTVNIVGDSLTNGFTSMKYCIHRADVLDFIIPGSVAIGTDIARTHYATCDLIKLSVDAYVKTAGTTNSSTFDINDDGATIITTKPSIASGGTSDIDNVCDAPTTVIAAGSALTVDVDAASSTQAQTAYLKLYVFPEAWIYMS